MDRIATFLSFIARSPDDPFPRYGLAMELRRAGRLDEAVREFRTLIERFPAYVPSYLMAGNLLAELGQTDEAKDVLARGVIAARQKGDAHAIGELETALAALA